MRSFNDVDIYGENEDPRAVEAAEFLMKMDNEGGLDGYLGWGGVERFPEELQGVAQTYADATELLRTAVNEWAAARGVMY